MLVEISREVTSERIKKWSQRKQHPIVYVTGDGSKYYVIKSNIAKEPGMLGP